jgi:NAD(P)-dependent dehydrogenase (short-subunit alcohol dehydrogenase family)
MKAIIAGGASGIGLATAQALAAQGQEVVVTGRNPEKLAALPPNIRGAQVDSTDRSALEAFMAATGPFDHLVLALSGAKGVGLFKDLDLQVLKEGFEEKFFPHLYTLQAALPYLMGSVTFITAVSGHARFPGIAGVASINGALEVIIPVLAKELQPVRVNAVSPGVIDTPWWSFLPETAKGEAFAGYARTTPVGRVGRPEDVAEVIVQLIHHTFITGQVITVDGGLGL